MTRFVCIGLCAWGAAGCDRPPSADTLKVWSPDDHHSPDDDMGAKGQVAPLRAADRGAASSTGDVAGLVDLAWRQQCTPCHGATGKGDGSMGAMLGASDLTRADWQAKSSDAEIAATIRSGRNKMPKFDLPDAVIAGLVARIRTLRGQ